MKNYHNSVILRPKLPQICIYLKIRKFTDSPLREKTDELKALLDKVGSALRKLYRL